MRTPNYFFSRYSIFLAFLIVTIGLGVLATPSGTCTKRDRNSRDTVFRTEKGGPAARRGIEAIAEICSVCHALTNITDSALSADEWRDTVQTMMDRGAALAGG